jgi:hypothetical protein
VGDNNIVLIVTGPTMFNVTVMVIIIIMITMMILTPMMMPPIMIAGIRRWRSVVVPWRPCTAVWSAICWSGGW